MKCRVRDVVTVVAFSGMMLMLFGGCTTTHYKKSADKEVYNIIEKGAQKIPGMESSFTIEQQQQDYLADLPVRETPLEEFMGEEAEQETLPKIVSLDKALEIAVHYNRDYQTRKENLYLAALDLTAQRHRYNRPIFGATLSGRYSRRTRDEQVFTPAARLAQAAPELGRHMATLTGAPQDLVNRYTQLVQSAARVTGEDQPRTDVVKEWTVSGQSNVSIETLATGGARIAMDLTSDFLRYLVNDPRESAQSLLSGLFRLPLLRGGGRLPAREALTQAERNVLYSLRDFTRYRKEFTVDVVDSYYNVLQTRDAVRNEWRGYQDQQQAAERERAMAEAGRTTLADLGRVEQAQLAAKDRWTRALQSYEDALDRFKIELGLTTDVGIVLDETELDRLMERGLVPLELDPEDAIKVALEARLDLYNTRGQVEDAERGVKIAANDLKPGLDLIVTGDADSMGNTQFEQFDFERARAAIGVDAELPLDRKDERNRYRESLISYERSLRQLDLSEDNVKLAVRQAWRTLQQAKQSYEILEIEVELNERRVEEQKLKAKWGRATVLDTVDAQNDLVDARNRRTEALIRYTMARLQLWRDMGILVIRDNGLWEEIDNAEEPA
jgi:outer membrane protein TolC